MPIFDVICKECKEEEEVILIHSGKIPDCKCGGKREKRPSASGFRIEGFAAWNGYSDDHCFEDSMPDNIGNKV